MALYLAVSVLLFISADAQVENKMGNLIGMMNTLKDEMIGDAKASATAYDQVATHCKETDAALTKSIQGETLEINSESGAIGTEFTQKVDKESDKSKRQADQQGMAKDLAVVVTDCSRKQSVHEADAADQKKAVASLTKAIGQMKARKANADKVGDKPSLLQEGVADSIIAYTLNVADAMNLIPEQDSGIAAVASDPAYKYHSTEITRIMTNLLTEFTGNQKARDDAWTKTESACNSEKAALSKKMKQNMDGIGKDGEAIQGLKADISRDKGDLIREETGEKSDQSQLKALTQSCQDEAVEWDRKTKLQGTTITALGEVINFLSNKKSSAAGSSAYKQAEPVLVQSRTHAQAKVASRVFLQKSRKSTPIKAVTNLLAKGTSSTAAELAKMEKIESFFRDESGKLSSPALAMIAMQVAGGKFGKVESLIQDLINRLMEEGNSEISKKAFCTTELAKAHKDRDIAASKADLMQADLKTMEAKKEQLEELNEVTLKNAINTLKKELQQAVDDRAAGKKTNLETIKTVMEGIEQLSEAQKFYAKAAGAKAQLEVATTPQALTAEESIGKGSKAIVALMATIMEDFQKMVSDTEAAEKGAAKDFVAYNQKAQEDIASKEMSLKLNKQELATTNNKIETTLADLDGQTSLISNAVKMVEGLKPVCLDAGGMNFKDRSQKRDEEVAALNEALKILRK